MAVALCSNGKGRQEEGSRERGLFRQICDRVFYCRFTNTEHIHKSFVLISKIYKTYFLNFLYKVSRDTIPYLFVACGGCCVSNLSFSFSPPLSSSSRIRFGIWLSKSKRKEGALEREGRRAFKGKGKGRLPLLFFSKVPRPLPSPPRPHTQNTNSEGAVKKGGGKSRFACERARGDFFSPLPPFRSLSLAVELLVLGIKSPPFPLPFFFDKAFPRVTQSVAAKTKLGKGREKRD